MDNLLLPGVVDSHPDLTHDLRASAAEEEQPRGEGQRLGEQVHQEDQFESDLHQRMAHDGGFTGQETGFSRQDFAQRSRNS